MEDPASCCSLTVWNHEGRLSRAFLRDDLSCRCNNGPLTWGQVSVDDGGGCRGSGGASGARLGGRGGGCAAPREGRRERVRAGGARRERAGGRGATVRGGAGARGVRSGAAKRPPP